MFPWSDSTDNKSFTKLTVRSSFSKDSHPIDVIEGKYCQITHLFDRQYTLQAFNLFDIVQGQLQILERFQLGQVFNFANLI